MILTLTILVYIVGWFVFAVAFTKYHAGKTVFYCHGEHRPGSMMPHHRWSEEGNCKSSCMPNCWRNDPKEEFNATATDVVNGSGMALLWPVLVLPVLVYKIANYEDKHTRTLKSIAKLEAEMEEAA